LIEPLYGNVLHLVQTTNHLHFSNKTNTYYYLLDSINNVSFELEIGIQKKTGYFQEKFAKKKNVIGKEKTEKN